MADNGAGVAARPVGRSSWEWAGGIVETVIFLTCLLYLGTNELWALLLWEIVAVLYLVVGGFVVWRGRARGVVDPVDARAVVRWMWIPPVLSAIVGANSAVTALVARSGGVDDAGGALLTIAASLGIILSWMLLQVGLSEVYQVLGATSREPELQFPGERAPATLDYLYFAFTIGTSFATSDVEVLGIRTRRVVLVHSIVGFFYNALVVAVAFQVLQGLASR
ncbi:Uncharacterized membrane protein [Microbacterium azadirachtae]|uniref:Uncharacterized membrane protein n=1 Tax=Microbacterium azadirachtae TaxID=582680 RepID=A0A1I6GC06_9MICO|nr:DUF1345 domain-containing protein [Microbacterium azadirachtae]SFR39698.1 Uncharacterized membrane protein [Microbacterium azadirachtae]